MLSRKSAIRKVFERHGEDSVYVTSTGYISRAVYNEYPDNKNIFYMQGSMGLSPCIGLGLALNTNRDVVVFTGDAAMLMHLGITHTIRDLCPENLYVYILDNGCHESVGGYECSPLEDIYVGVKEIIKISSDGKMDRVRVDCVDNTNSIKEFLT